MKLASNAGKSNINTKRNLKKNGFSLIELITVISIMLLVISLVGPLTLNFIDKTKAQSEFISLKNNLKKISFLSFAGATQRTIRLEENEIFISKSGTIEFKYTFEYIKFDSQEILLNSRGYPSPELLTVIFNNKVETVNLFQLIEGVDGKIN